jgi:hypothetical protein
MAQGWWVSACPKRCDRARWLAKRMYLASCRPGQTAALELHSHLAGWCCFLAGDAGWEGPVVSAKALVGRENAWWPNEGSAPGFRVQGSSEIFPTGL